MQYFSLLLNTQFLISFFTPLLAALILSLILAVAFHYALRLLPQDRVVAYALVSSSYHPMLFLIWSRSLLFAYATLVDFSPFEGDTLWLLRLVPLITLAWFILYLSKTLSKGLVESWKRKKKKYDETMVNTVSKLINTFVFILIFIFITQNLGLNLSGILAFGGIGGLAVSFAAKDLLANLFGALSIHWDSPFKVGDWIRSPDKQIEGTVEHIGWRLTRIRTFDKRPLYVPNSLFSTISIENPSRMKNRRFKENLSLRYEDVEKVNEISNKIEQYLRSSPYIDTKQTLFVNLDCFNSFSLDILIYTFTKTTNWVEFQKIKQILFLDIYKIAKECGADIAFPTSTILLNRPPAKLTLVEKERTNATGGPMKTKNSG